MKKHKKQPDAENHNLFFETYGLQILQSLRRIIRAVDIHSRRLKNEYDVTAPQMICLYSLVTQDSMMLSELAKKVNLSASTVNGIVDRLEMKGWARRRRSETDRRKVYIEVTELGRELTHEAPLLLQDRLSEALRRLPETEQANIARSLERVVQLMEIEHLDASPNLLPNAQLSENNEKDQYDHIQHAKPDYSGN